VLGVKKHNPDSASPRYGQQRVEESLGCKMSGWLTPKLMSIQNLCGIPSSSTVLKTARWSVLGVKNNNPDSASPRYGQQRVDQSLGCKMSGWLTPKLVSTDKL
jgi:hypothetical protein